ncbi:hypothetical protein MPHL43072_18695 [Mycolicibacterium phlei DSM 43072]|uniref:Uncharacterized protein n=1 Tax=Mycolicibacterium phlei DSM 43239 = CCUG 21000 TaxID=1226750 RepID=A0A5N5V9V5_MYCPH|nr:hypothetical protein MPHL21000_06050 [Mycolicibacterium phlei DSM 43239 = CCUG 21000]KXW67058.1 hypothetical protein MPHL43239_07220 [Mycolicibacterium phlei DSM 43239 = CCUG 21000]KXW70465.1 hypothetical protein MPHL43072_18695 [Mycolicibacterium phlei DSM 43072]KXW73973.1 hypothetical protein MPHL43070_09590 [Mycolicibacterium phlei DSM 43070]
MQRRRVDEDPGLEPSGGPGVVDVEHDVGVLEAEPAARQREPRLIGGLLGAEQDSVPVQAVGQLPELGALDGQADRVEHPVGQHAVRFGVDTDRADLGGAADDRAAVALAVGEAADDAVGPARFALLPLEDRHRFHAERTERLPRAVPDGDELVAALGHRPRDQRLLLGQRRELRWVAVDLGRREALGGRGQHTGQQ